MRPIPKRSGYLALLALAVSVLAIGKFSRNTGRSADDGNEVGAQPQDSLKSSKVASNREASELETEMDRAFEREVKIVESLLGKILLGDSSEFLPFENARKARELGELKQKIEKTLMDYRGYPLELRLADGGSTRGWFKKHINLEDEVPGRGASTVALSDLSGGDYEITVNAQYSFKYFKGSDGYAFLGEIAGTFHD